MMPGQSMLVDASVVVHAGAVLSCWVAFVESVKLAFLFFFVCIVFRYRSLVTI